MMGSRFAAWELLHWLRLDCVIRILFFGPFISTLPASVTVRFRDRGWFHFRHFDRASYKAWFLKVPLLLCLTTIDIFLALCAPEDITEATRRALCPRSYSPWSTRGCWRLDCGSVMAVGFRGLIPVSKLEESLDKRVGERKIGTEYRGIRLS